MNPLEYFADFVKSKPLSDAISQKKFTQLSGLSGSSFSFLIASLFKEFSQSFLIVISDKERSAYIFNELQSLLNENQVHYYPESARHPYKTEEVDNASVQERAELLNVLSTRSSSNIVITTTQAITEKVASKKALQQNTLIVKTGERISLDFINEFLSESNFNRVDFFYEPGQYAISGWIFDVLCLSN